MQNPRVVRSGNVVAAFFGAVKANQFIDVDVGFRVEPGDLLLVVPVEDDGLDSDEIFDGDFIIVRMNFYTDELEPGVIVLARTPLGLLISHLYLTLEGDARFAPSNKDCESYLFRGGTFKILGIMVEVVKLNLTE